jgi:hypothetical protein
MQEMKEATWSYVRANASRARSRAHACEAWDAPKRQVVAFDRANEET